MLAENLRKYETILRNASPVNLKRHYQISEQLWQVERKLASGAISVHERNIQAKLLHDEEADSLIPFDSQADFAAFCEWHGAQMQTQYQHEQEHIAVYEKYGIPCKFGFTKIASDDGHVGLIPWITPIWQGQPILTKLRIMLEALENAAEKSEGDMQDIAALQHILDQAG